ncbi:hypothetical protein V6N13_029567 [Hibiscus sabdariffa]
MQSYQQLPNLENYQQMELNEASGPESIAFDCKSEGPYVGVSDGKEIWVGKNLQLLHQTGPNGGKAQQLATSAEGVPFKLANALDIDTDTGDDLFY